MNAVQLRSSDLIARRENQAPEPEDLIVAARRGQAMRIAIEPASSRDVLGSSRRSLDASGSFREGCIKAVEARIWPLAQKSSVLAEIHRRLDRLAETGRCDQDRATAMAAIYDFAGAWALAARLIQSGLRVVVVEDAFPENAVHEPNERADVEILLSAGPTCEN